MPTIRLLPENLANRIAAGEVVERPASIVKELVENAIDAGATRIEVELRDGGRTLIRVTDNGSGMSPEDLTLAVQRFATSKLAEPEDLERILTMGFRGEALPSIGAVSQLCLTSRPPEATEGASLRVAGGTLTAPQPAGCPPGTSVEVAHLFYNTPARLKFLATSATERGHCLSWVQYLAMSRPDIAFKVVHEGQVVFTAPGGGDLRAVLGAIYGGTAAREFLPVQAETPELTISGFLSGPRLTRATRQHQHFFVNRRYVKSRHLSHALSEAYGMLLGAGKLPVCAIHFTLAPEEVDPNVHPTKIEVRFRNSARVHQSFQRACEETLAAAGFRSLTQTGPRWDTPAPAGVFPGVDEQQRLQAQRLRVNPFADLIDPRDDGLELFNPPPPPPDEPPQPQLLEQPAVSLEPEVLGQLSDKYIVARIGGDLLLIDQHRAAERVLLHRLEQQPEQAARQLLAVPLTLELTPAEAAAVEQHTALLAALGFEVEPFGPTACLLRSIPAALADKGYAVAVRELVEDLTAWEVPTAEEKRKRELQGMIACRAAIKKGMGLSTREITELVQDLLATDAPAVCPHGDPIIISMTGAQLDRRFRR